MKSIIATILLYAAVHCSGQTNVTTTNATFLLGPFTNFASVQFHIDGWEDLTTNKYYIARAKLFEAQHQIERGASDDSKVPIDSTWVYVSYCAEESANIPHYIGVYKVIAAHGEWVEVISCHAFPSTSTFDTGAMFYFDYKKDFLKRNHRIEPYIIK